jgi:hypothetical protein
MGLLDRLTGGAEKVAREAEKVFEQGKTKVEELQLERQMDTAARKLGYLEFDVHRGKAADPARKEELLKEISELEEQLGQMKQAAAQDERNAPMSGEMGEVQRVQEAAAAAGVAPNPVTQTGEAGEQAPGASTPPGPLEGDVRS